MPTYSPSIFFKWQCGLVVFAWGASLGIPLGIGILAARLDLGIAILFVALAMCTGAAFVLIRGLGKWRKRACLFVLLGSVLLGIGLGIQRSAVELPIALLLSGFAFLIVTDKLWAPVMRHVENFTIQNRILRWGTFLLTLAALLQIVRFSLFMVDPTFKPGWPFPFAKELYKHQCFAAYIHAAALNEKGVTDLYNPAWYDPNMKLSKTAADSHRAEPIVEGTSGLLTDLWQYPPQALVLPQIGLKFTKSYAVLRTGWFAIQSVMIALLLIFIVRSLGPNALAWTWMPLLWISIPFIHNMEYGQFHFLVICASAYAAIQFEKDNNVRGGFFLAWAISLKLFPAFLMLHLLFKRRWSAMGSTVLWSIVILLISLPIVGISPYIAFIQDQLLRILGGGAWNKFLDGDWPRLGQFAIYSILFSLRNLGGGDALASIAPYALLAYTVFVVGIIWISAHRPTSPLAGMAIVNLGGMATYFTPPDYGAVGVTALVLLSAGFFGRRTTVLFLTLSVWFFFSCTVSPGSLPVVWKNEAIKEIILIVIFIAAVLTNSFVATRRPYTEGDEI
jgi:hypothetical protein